MSTTPRPAPDLGSTWIWMRDGKPWPVVLCPDEHVPRQVLDMRRDTKEIPAILLGSRKYIWVRDDTRLQAPLDANKEYVKKQSPFGTDDIQDGDNDEIRKEKQRRTAFKQDALGWYSPAFWSNFIQQASDERKLKREMVAKHGAKRKGSTNSEDDIEVVAVARSSTERTACHSQKRIDDDTPVKRSKHSQLPTPKATPSRRRRHAEKPATRSYSIGVGDSNKVDDESKSSNGGPLRCNVAEDDKTGITDGSPTTIDDVDEKEKKKWRVQQLARQHEQCVRDSLPSPDTCTIFVGEEKSIYHVPTEAVTEHDYLQSLILKTPDFGTHINLWATLPTSAQEFKPISQYLTHGDFAPKYIPERNGALARLQNTIIPEQKMRAAETCALVFVAASHLRMERLQALVVDKLRTLYPLPPVHILILVRCLTRASCSTSTSSTEGGEARAALFDWLADHVAEYYFLLMREHGRQLCEGLRDDEELLQAVLERVLRDPKGCWRGVEDG